MFVPLMKNTRYLAHIVKEVYETLVSDVRGTSALREIFIKMAAKDGRVRSKWSRTFGSRGFFLYLSL